MGEFLHLLRDILWLRRGPQDLPYSPALLLALCILDFALQWGLAQLLGVDGGSLALNAVTVVIALGFVYLLLMARGVANRFVQTAVALTSVSMVVTLVMSPILFVVLDGKPKLEPPLTPLQSLFAIASLPIGIWKFVVDAHIFRHALSVSLARGFAAAAAWVAVHFVIELAQATPG